MERRLLGRIGESAARSALRRRGYAIQERNVRCPMGELDLVAAHQGCIVFIEVKTRTTDEFGDPFEAIPPAKQRRLQRLAVYYLTTRRLWGRPCRFDAVSVTVTPDGRIARVDVLADAFQGEAR